MIAERGLTEQEIETIERHVINEISRVAHNPTLTVAEARRRIALAAIGALPNDFIRGAKSTTGDLT